MLRAPARRSVGSSSPHPGHRCPRRYRYYVSAALITDAAKEGMQSWRLAAQEIEDCVIGMLVDALTSPASLLERIGSPGTPSDQIRRVLGRAARLAATLRSSPGERAKIVRELVEQVIIDEKRILIKLQRSAVLGGNVPSGTSEEPDLGTLEVTAAVDFKQRGAETKLVLPGLSQHNQPSRCDPTLLKAIARGRAWFEELATGRARSLGQLAERDGITRRYIRRLVDLAFLSPLLVEAILQGRQPVELTATRLIELDLPLDWAQQHRLLTS
jgi:site-specific DNA recombinase